MELEIKQDPKLLQKLSNPAIKACVVVDTDVLAMHRAIYSGDNKYDVILAKKFDRIIPYARLNFCVLAFPVSNAFFSSDDNRILL